MESLILAQSERWRRA